jgi:chromosomal replication initiation ATPase DnaA
MVFDPACQERVPDPRYRGMNPAFVKMVWEKRRKEQSAKIAKATNVEKRIERKVKALSEELIVAGLSRKARAKATDIIRAYAEETEFSYEDIVGHNRSSALVKVRQAAMAEAYIKCPHMSLKQLGAIFGKDHSSLLVAVKRAGVHTSQTGQAREYKTPQYNRAA